MVEKITTITPPNNDESQTIRNREASLATRAEKSWNSPFDLVNTQETSEVVDTLTVSELFNMLDSGNKELEQLMAEETAWELVEEAMDEIDKTAELSERGENNEPSALNTPLTIVRAVEKLAAPETGVEANKIFMNWYIEANKRVGDAVNSHISPDKRQSLVYSWASWRSKQKLEYFKWLSETMKDKPEEMRKAIRNIDFITNFQLLVEADIFEDTNDPDLLLNKPQKLEIMDRTITTVLNSSVGSTKMLNGIGDFLPQTEEYRRKFESTREGILAEVQGVTYIEEAVASLKFSGYEDIHVIRNPALDKNEIDCLVWANGNPQRIIMIEIKKGHQPRVLSVEDRGTGVGVFEGENQRDRGLDHVPPGFIDLVGNPARIAQMIGAHPNVYATGLSLRVNSVEKDQQEFRNKLSIRLTRSLQ